MTEEEFDKEFIVVPAKTINDLKRENIESEGEDSDF